MNLFNLPDLGEGLPDAEIHEWFVKEGDSVEVDQPLVSMETAKAVVDVPSPQKGIIEQLFGAPGEIIKTGSPLVSFVSSLDKPADKGTVVGHLEEQAEVSEDHFIIGAARPASKPVKATARVRIEARKLGLDLNQIQGSGEHGLITLSDLQAQVEKNAAPPPGYEPLRGVRRAMLHSMVQSHQEIVPVSLFDEADLAAWPPETDITVRLMRAIVEASSKEPALNAWFDGQHGARKCFNEVHLGLAMDNDEGLFVPVISDVGQKSDQLLRSTINQLKEQLSNRSLPSDQLKGATITLSNFGKFAGRFASPIIVPPMVAILAVGKLYEGVVATPQGPALHKLLPLSLSFDHRAVTGGEATRFLGAVIQSLQRASAGVE